MGFKSFWKNESGVALIMFAIALPIILLIMALAIDMNKIQGGSDGISNATDSSASAVSELILLNAKENTRRMLNAGSEPPEYLKKDEMDAAALKMIEANIKNQDGIAELVPESFSLVLDDTNKQISVSACLLVKPNTLAGSAGLSDEQKVCSNSVAPIICPEGANWDGTSCISCPSEIVTGVGGRNFYVVGEALKSIDEIRKYASGIHSTPGHTTGPNGGNGGNGPRGTSMHGQEQINSYISITGFTPFYVGSKQTRGWQTYRGLEFLDINSPDNMTGLRFYMSSTQVPDYALDADGKCKCQNRYFMAPGKKIYIRAGTNMDDFKANQSVFHFEPGHTAGPNGGNAGNRPRGTSMFSPATINEYNTVSSLRRYNYGSSQTRGWQRYRSLDFLDTNNPEQNSGLRFVIEKPIPVCAEPL